VHTCKSLLLGDALEACERIFTSPVPLVYTRHTARFLSVWWGLPDTYCSPRHPPHFKSSFVELHGIL